MKLRNVLASVLAFGLSSGAMAANLQCSGSGLEVSLASNTLTVKGPGEALASYSVSVDMDRNGVGGASSSDALLVVNPDKSSELILAGKTYRLTCGL